MELTQAWLGLPGSSGWVHWDVPRILLPALYVLPPKPPCPLGCSDCCNFPSFHPGHRSWPLWWSSPHSHHSGPIFVLSHSLPYLLLPLQSYTIPSSSCLLPPRYPSPKSFHTQRLRAHFPQTFPHSEALQAPGAWPFFPSCSALSTAGTARSPHCLLHPAALPLCRLPWPGMPLSSLVPRINSCPP